MVSAYALYSLVVYENTHTEKYHMGVVKWF